MKALQILRLIVQIVFMLGLFWSLVPHSDIVGQKLFLSIFFMGVFFCGWVCPFGTLQEMLAKLGRCLRLPRYQMPKSIQKYLQFSRYFFYGATLFGISITWLNARSAFTHRLFIGTLTTSVSIVLILFLILSLFMDRPFCNYFCTKGAFYGLLSPLRLFSIRRNESCCIHCHLCDKKCPMNIAIEKTRFVRHPNCINCFQCMSVCPKKCLSYRLLSLKRNQTTPQKSA